MKDIVSHLMQRLDRIARSNDPKGKFYTDILKNGASWAPG